MFAVLAVTFTAKDWLLISMFLGILAWVLYRPQSRRDQRQLPSEQSDSQSELHTLRTAQTEQAHHKLQIQLHDYERDVSGRMQTRLAVLDQLIVEADQKINLLQRALSDLRASNASRSPGEIVVFPGTSQAPASGTPRSDADPASRADAA